MFPLWLITHDWASVSPSSVGQMMATWATSFEILAFPWSVTQLKDLCSFHHFNSYCSSRSQVRAISIVTRLRAGQWGSVPGRGKKCFSSPKHPDWLWGPSSLVFKLFPPGLKQLWHEDNHWPPSTAVVKNEWDYTFAPPCMFSWCGQVQL